MSAPRVRAPRGTALTCRSWPQEAAMRMLMNNLDPEVAENRRLASPASVDSLPTSAMQEDHVSMGWGAARKLRTAVENLGRILAVELVCAARALDLRAPLRPGPGTAAALARVRERVEGPGPDRLLAPELASAEALVASAELIEAVEARVGALQ